MTDRNPRQEWATPDEFFAVVNEEFQFDLDAAATAENAKCALCIDPESNALSKQLKWVDPKAKNFNVWLNPGFSGIEPWVKRAYEESQRHADAVVVVMALVSPSTHWWRDWALLADEIRLIGGKRVQFVPPEGVKKSSNSKENCLLIFRGDHDENREPHIWTWDWVKEVAEQAEAVK